MQHGPLSSDITLIVTSAVLCLPFLLSFPQRRTERRTTPTCLRRRTRGYPTPSTTSETTSLAAWEDTPTASSSSLATLSACYPRSLDSTRDRCIICDRHVEWLPLFLSPVEWLPFFCLIATVVEGGAKQHHHVGNVHHGCHGTETRNDLSQECCVDQVMTFADETVSWKLYPYLDKRTMEHQGIREEKTRFTSS